MTELLERQLEAILFVADEPLPSVFLAQALETDRRATEEALESLQRGLAEADRGDVIEHEQLLVELRNDEKESKARLDPKKQKALAGNKKAHRQDLSKKGGKLHRQTDQGRRRKTAVLS